MNILSLSLLTGSSLLTSTFEHIVNKKHLKDTPQSEYGYHTGLNLLRNFLEASKDFTVEELQGLTGQSTSAPSGSKKEDVIIEDELLEDAAGHLDKELGENGIKLVGGKQWWRWRETQLQAEWIETNKHYDLRTNGKIEDMALLYIHGGAFYFGSPDTMRFQSLAFSKKIGVRVLAVNYRLAPQYPFPCGLQDCLAAYLHLLKTYPPTNIVIGGDSAGGNLTLALMVVLRNQGFPLPAGGILLSPWVDLAHSFPSCAAETKNDYIPHRGFQQKPSFAWPPPAIDKKEVTMEKVEKIVSAEKVEVDLSEIEKKAGEEEKEKKEEAMAIGKLAEVPLKTDQGDEIRITEQIHMYAPNELITHPLVSLVNESTLGGLPPLLITTGGGEKLHDEHVYLAHKAADPEKYRPSETILKAYPERAKYMDKYPPTDVKLQIYNDCCHVVTTLGFTKPAKLSFRSFGAFGKWALARANGKEIGEMAFSILTEKHKNHNMHTHGAFSVGQFENHMIRERITPKGDVIPLEPASELPALNLPRESIGVIKQDFFQLWLEQKQEYEKKWGTVRREIQKKLNAENKDALMDLPEGENPPASALYRRRKRESANETKMDKRQSITPSILWNRAQQEKVDNNGNGNGDGEKEGEDNGKGKDVQSKL